MTVPLTPFVPGEEQAPAESVPWAESNIKANWEQGNDVWASVQGETDQGEGFTSQARAQRFAISAPQTLTYAKLRAVNRGNPPPDAHVYVEIYSDLLHDPIATSNQLHIPALEPMPTLSDGASVDSTVPMTEFTFTPTALAAGSYWLVIRRTDEFNQFGQHVSVREWREFSQDYPSGEAWRLDGVDGVGSPWVNAEWTKSVTGPGDEWEIEFELGGPGEAATTVATGLDLNVNLDFGGMSLKAYGAAHGLNFVSGPETVLLSGVCREADRGGVGVLCTGDQVRVGETVPNGDFETWGFGYDEFPWPYSALNSPFVAWPDKTKVTEAERNVIPVIQAGSMLDATDRAVISTLNPFAGSQHLRYECGVGEASTNRKGFWPNTGWWCSSFGTYNILRCQTGDEITVRLRHMANINAPHLSLTCPQITLNAIYVNQFKGVAVSGGSQPVGTIDVVPTTYSEFLRTWTVPASNLSTTVYAVSLSLDYRIDPWFSLVASASGPLVLDIDDLSVTVVTP